MKHWNKYLIVFVVLLISPLAQAHNDHITVGFVAGLSHPFSGIDHLLALVLAGLFVGRLITKRRVAIGFLLFALGLGISGALLMGVQAGMETAILISIPVFVAVQWLTQSVQVKVAFATISLFMVSHGWMHGIELAGMHNSFVFGLLLASAVVLSLSGLLGSIIKSKRITLSHA